MNKNFSKSQTPLADRLRSRTFAEFFGQEKLTGVKSFLPAALESGQLPSLILWGPPGTGKTTLALLIANSLEAEFVKFSAVTEGVKDLRLVIDRAKENKIIDKKTILFIDEIHRWNKAQQDALLPHIENGVIILIGATTENPSFELRNALLSRCRVLVLESLNREQLAQILERALVDEECGLGSLNLEIDDEAKEFLLNLVSGDARGLLNILEVASLMTSKITKETIEAASQRTSLLYDKNGEEHYNLISALHKSLRGSDADAALYWLVRIIEAGEDPLYIARRLIRFASEDVGLANSLALTQATAAYDACKNIGLPECGINLAQATVYLAKCQKSNELYAAYNQATALIRQTGYLPVPVHLRNAPTSLMKELDYGKDYKYSPDFNYQEEQDYFPESLKKVDFFKK